MLGYKLFFMLRICCIIYTCSVSVCSQSAFCEEVDRPRLFFGTEDKANLQTKLAREPFQSVVKHYVHILNDAGGFQAYAATQGELLGGLKNISKDVADDMDMQMAAVAFVATDDLSYARKAKSLLMDRMKNWEQFIPSAGRGGSTQVSRSSQFFCWVYDFIQPSGVLTPEEEGYIERILAMGMSRLMERGETFNPYDYRLPTNNMWSESYLLRMDNYNSDRVMALGMFALTFPTHPSSENWLAHALEEFDWQMDNSRMPDGSWKEAPRYHGAVLRCFVPFAYALKRNKEINLFEDKRFKAMFESLIHYQTPRDATVGNVALMPGIADANWENAWEVFFGWGTAAYRDSDPELASRLMWAWNRAGSPFNVELSPANQMAGLIFIDDSVKPAPQPPLRSENLASGYTVLRSGFDTPQESYFMMATATHREHLGHHQWDNGSFSLYAWNTPLTVDPGSRDYSLLNEWYARSKSHNVVVFDEEDIKVNGTVSRSFFHDSLDYIEADFSGAVKGNYKRRVLFVRPHFYLIWDDINTPEEATYHLHVLATDDPTHERPVGEVGTTQHLSFPCQNNVDLDLRVLLPDRLASDSTVTVNADPYPVEFFTEKDYIMKLAYRRTPKWVRVKQNEPLQDFLTVLYPKQTSSPDLDLLRYEPVQQNRQAANSDSLDDSKHRGGSLVEFKLGTVKARFILGSADHGTDKLEGDGAVVILDSASDRHDTFLINGKNLQTAERIKIALDDVATIVCSTLRPQEAFELHVVEGAGIRATLDLPWSSPIDKVHVFDPNGAEVIGVNRDSDDNTLELELRHTKYLMLVEPLQPTLFGRQVK